MSTKFRVVMTLVLISVGVSAARAQHGHGDEKKGEEHGKPVPFTMPTTYRLGVREIELCCFSRNWRAVGFGLHL